MTNKIKEDILKYTCIKYRDCNKKQPLVQHELSDLLWQNIGCDIFENKGKIYVLVIDYYSKIIETIRKQGKHPSSVISAPKSVFVRYGIPYILMADNVPYNSQEFKNFSNQYNFILKTSCPNYSQSDRLSEIDVKIVKRINKKCKDPCLGLLEYHNTSNMIYTTSTQ